MMIGAEKSLYWIGIAGLVGMLAMGGCSKKNVAATTTGTETSQASAQADGGAGGGGMTQPRDTQAKADQGKSGGSGGGSMGGPLQGMSKSPKDEGVQSPPMVVAKADQAEIDARRAREAAQKQLADIYFAFDKAIATSAEAASTIWCWGRSGRKRRNGSSWASASETLWS
jgi:hypothetical protein